MLNLWKKFALLTIVGSLLCSAMVAGCGGGEGDDDAATNNTTTGTGDAE